MVTYQVYLPVQYNFQLFALGLGGYLPTEAQLSYINKVSNVNVAFFWLTIYFVKASFLALYWAIFEVSTKFRLAWMVVTAYTLISFLITFLAIFWSCGKPSQINNLGMSLLPNLLVFRLLIISINIAACNGISQELILNLETMWCVLNTFGDIISKLIIL